MVAQKRSENGSGVKADGKRKRATTSRYVLQKCMEECLNEVIAVKDELEQLAQEKKQLCQSQLIVLHLLPH